MLRRKRCLGDLPLRRLPVLSDRDTAAEALRVGEGCVVVEGTGRPLGVVRPALLESCPPQRPLGELVESVTVLPQRTFVLSLLNRRLRFPLLVTDEGGRFVGALEAEQLLAALQEDASLLLHAYKSLLEAVPVGVVVANWEGEVRFVNPEAERLLGVSAREILGRPVREVLPNRDLEVVLAEGQPLPPRRELIGERPTLVAQHPLTCRDGGGKVIGAAALLKDLSELESSLRRVQTLQEVVRSLERVFEEALEGVVVVDERGVVQYINERCARLFGSTKAEAMGRHITELAPRARLPEVVRTGVPERGVILEVGGHRLVVNRIPLKEDGQVVGAVGVVLFRDWEELREMAERLSLLESKVEHYQSEIRRLVARYDFAQIVGESPAIRRAKEMARRVAHTDYPVLLVGESGTGKELFAHAIHRASPRAQGDFVAVNCAAIPAELLEAELFGYEPGAFTGARSKGKPGKFELADGGTLFLDEIADMPPQMQAKLLRALQEKEIERVGATRPRRVDFRLICATHEEPEELVATGRLREDLFYRISVIRIDIPPLRERLEDVPLLARHFLHKVSPRLRLSEEALKALQAYRWPGNVRELRNVVEVAATLCEGEVVEASDLPLPTARPRVSLRGALSEAERELLAEALRAAGGCVSEAARRLGVHRTVIYAKLRKYPELRRLLSRL